MPEQKCPDKNCKVKGQKTCSHPDRPKKNRSKCIYYVPTPCDKCSLKGNLYGNKGNPESKVLVVSGSNYDTHFEDIMTRIGSAAADTSLPISYYCTTAVKCVTDKKPSMALIRKCNSYLKKELEIIKPKFVLVVGETAFKALLWDFDLVTRRKPEIDACAGSHIIKDNVVYFVIHDLRAIKADYIKNAELKEHLKDFIKYVNGLKKIKPVHYKEIESEEDLIYILKEAEKTGRISVDIETDPLTAFLPNSEILSISFTVKEGESFCIPLSWPTNSYFKKWGFIPKINVLLAILYIKKILANPNIVKIFHNGAYDITWLEYIFSCEVKNYDDTMIMKFLMNQNDKDRKGLKLLTKQYLDMGYYEYQIKQYVGEGESYSNIPPRILMHYNNCDTDATLRLWNIFTPKIKELKLEDIHYKFMIPNLRGIINLQKDGIAINKNLCVEMKYKEEERLVGLFSELRTLPQVANFERIVGLEFKPSSPKHMFAMVYGGELTSEEEVPRKIDSKTGKKIGRKELIKVDYNWFNLKPIMVSAKNSVTGKREQRKSFGKEAIKKYLKGIYKGIEYLDPINTYNLDSLPCNTDIMKFIKLISEISSIETQLSNHIIPFIDIWSKTIDGCVHTSYDITGTTTGRLACIAKGTMISYPDRINSCIGTKKIEDIRAGDEVYTFDDNNNCLIKKVNWAGRTGYEQCLTLIYRLNGKEITLDTTYDHKIRLFGGAWREAIHIDNRHKVLALGQDYLGIEVPITASVFRIQNSLMQDVYNLEVEETHRFIANGICVKNSRSPNLQNLKREGFVKRAFISRWGDEGILLEFDYKQLELFIMAIVSHDQKFVYAFTHGLDLHTKTAAHIVFHVLESAVTKQMRTNAKITNFGMIYLKTAYTLKDDLNVSEEEAQRIIDNFFIEYSGVKKYIDTVINTARSKGYVTTIMGRRRYLDYSLDPNGADRQAVNTTIQSPASDVCVTAVNQLQEYYAKVAKAVTNKIVKKVFDINQRENERVAILSGTVHDSVIVDCKKKYINEIVSASKLIMENTGLKFITIPLKIDVKYGPNLLDTEEWDGSSEIKI